MQDLDELYDEIYGDEESEEYEYEDHGVSEIQDDIEYEEKMFYKGFPELEDIYNEKFLADDIPSNYNERQVNIFKKGVKKIQDINKKYGCGLSFSAIVKLLDQRYDDVSKRSYKSISLTDVMSNEVWDHTCFLANKMTEKKAYTTFSTKKLENELKNNFNEISKVMRLYVELNPDKFPVEERQNNHIFNSNGKLRSTFKQKHADIYLDVDLYVEFLKDKAVRTSKEYFGKFTDPKKAQEALLNRVNKIIRKDEPITSQGDRVARLAECVRLLRPLQAKRENRSILQYFTNHDVYVMERDTLRQCKKEMLSLGLDAKEISKVLHGGAFNEVKFNDGMNVREKQQNPNMKDTISSNEVSNQVNVEIINEKRKSLVIEDAIDKSQILDNKIEEESKIINMNKTF